MKTAKRVCTMLLVLCMSMLAGCHADRGNPSPGNIQETTGSKEKQTEAQTEAQTGQEDVTLTFWDMAWAGEAYYNTMQKLIEQFEAENPGIKIDYQSIPWDGYVQNFTTAVVSGAGPDFATAGSSMQHLFAKMDEILYLDSIMEEWKVNGEDRDFLPGTLESMRYEGHLVGIPWNYDPMMLWYNTEHFEAAGITKTPENTQELYDTLVKLKNAGYGGLVTDITFNYKTLTLWQMFAWNMGDGGLYKDGEIIVDNDASKDAFEYIRTLVNDGLMPKDVAGFNDPDAVRYFLQGNASIVFNNLNVQRIAKDSNPDMVDKIAVMKPFATGTANPSNQIMGFSQTKYPEETKTAIAWFSSHESSLFTDSDLTAVPVRISIGKEEKVQERGQMQFIIENVLPSGKPNGYPNAELYPEFQTIMSDGIITNAVQRTILTEDAIDDIAADARAEIEKILGL